ncbi:MAG: hypothetical protein ACI96V_002122 [Thalassolituus oleivorans]|jgi:hypothetical protein
MNNLTEHNTNLRRLFASQDKTEIRKSVDLDSIDLVLREVLTIKEMREAGSFFTGQELASKVVSSFQAPITFSSVVLDPTCGAGNLLIEVSRTLGVEATLSETLKIWGGVLWGFDLHQHFIEATKLRLIIEALNRGVVQDCGLEEACSFFENIRVQDGLSLEQLNLEKVTHVVMNPPFTIMPSPNNYYWKKGKVNTAGVVLDSYLRSLPTGCNISAVLPDVLRSGSRYQLLRCFVSSLLQGDAKVWGRFNRKTDVDVFLLSGRIVPNAEGSVEWQKPNDITETINDFFDVRTGPLVAYRDPEEGPEYPYFYPKNCKKWAVVNEVVEKRRFLGKVLDPPFVVIKRTSSPTDRNRASATLINLKVPVAVENHMIVLKPKDDKLKTCKKLIKVLRKKRTDEFLNERIRLRHLTVGVVKEIPFIEEI